jgi:hypothetical protein
MSDKWDERKAALLRQANTAFAKPNAEQSKTAGTPPQTAGRGSEMVHKSAPAPNGPKPPGVERTIIIGEKHRTDMSNEDKKAKEANRQASGKSSKPVIQLTEEQKKQAEVLKERFRKAAQKEQERDR